MSLFRLGSCISERVGDDMAIGTASGQGRCVDVLDDELQVGRRYAPAGSLDTTMIGCLGGATNRV